MQSTDFTTQTSENGFIGIGPTARATIGAFRVSNATTALAARNAAGGADIALVATTAADKVVIGDGVTAATLDIKAAGDTAVLRGAATKATIGAAKVTLTDGALELGLSAVVSTVGNVRVPNATTAVAARNAGGGADIALIATTGADQVAIGDAVNAATLALKAVGDTTIARGITTKLTVGAAKIVAADGAIDLGSAGVAAAGNLRAPNATTVIAARNQLGTADIVLAATSNANSALFGDGVNAATLALRAAGDTTVVRGVTTKLTIGAAKATLADGVLELGSAAIATSGNLRVPNATTALAALNQAGGADIALVATNNVNAAIFGDAVNAATVALKAAGDATVVRGANVKVTVGAAKVTLADGVVELGSASTAVAGNLRAPNATTVLAARNAAGGADIALVATSNADDVTIGDGVNAATLAIKALGNTTILRGATTKITVANTLVTMADGLIEMGAGGPQIIKGAGSPEGSITAPIGSIFQSTGGGSGTTLYIKESGAGNTGWVAYSPGAVDVAVTANTLNCWNLNDAASPFANSGSSAATLAVSGASIRYQQTGGGPNLGIGLFNTTKTFITGAAGAANRPAGSNITIHAWVRFRSVANATQAIFHRKYTASGGTWVNPFNCIGLWFVAGSLFEAQVTTGANGAGAKTTLTTDTVFGVGVDYHVAATYDGTTLSAICNGELVGTAAPGAAIDWNTAVEGPWVSGGVDSGAGDARLLGVVRRPRVESVVMTLAQIQNIYKHGIAST